MALSGTYFMKPQKSPSGVLGFKPIASRNL
jgi:hypothetical protein